MRRRISFLLVYCFAGSNGSWPVASEFAKFYEPFGLMLSCSVIGIAAMATILTGFVSVVVLDHLLIYRYGLCWGFATSAEKQIL